MNSLKIYHKDIAYENMSFIDAGTIYTNENKEFLFELENTTPFDIVDISFETNLPKDSYVAYIPPSIKPHSRESMVLSITDGHKLMYEMDGKPSMQIKYTVERVF